MMRRARKLFRTLPRMSDIPPMTKEKTGKVWDAVTEYQVALIYDKDIEGNLLEGDLDAGTVWGAEPPRNTTYVTLNPCARIKMARHRLTQNELEYYIERLSELSSDKEVNQHMNAEEDIDLSDAASMHSDYLSESEIEASDSEEKVETDDEMPDLPPGNYFYGKNRFKWAKSEPASSRTHLQNIVTHLPGPKGPATTNKPETPFKAWSLLFTVAILEIILEYTNARITELSTNYGNTATFVDHIDKTEPKAFLGLLLLFGVYKSACEDAAGLCS
ncbi:hypothetical protein QE152_g29774 [Popillia japonica]|uniref:PiggyBac transposable element-derived protein domain-containing protein n=1 Tax=Popillia japonica TaxID=7064 RepID=A0AAW1JGI5_POPJA